MNKFFLFVTVLLLCGCAKPAKDYDYISLSPASGWKEGENLTLSLNLEDTVHTYALYLTARIRNTQALNEINAFPTEVALRSPSGRRYSSIVTLPLNVIQKREHYRQSNGMMEIEWPFLKNVRNREIGTWQITLRQTAGADIYKSITGFGVSYKKDK